MTSPDVSVVMSVCNGGDALVETLDSVLKQTGCVLELIVVNDGSTDQTGHILESFMGRDPRVHVIHQENRGLTKALVRGCAIAKGEFVARQDSGDISLPGRLASQLRVLRENGNVVLVSSSTRFLAPRGEWLYDVTCMDDELEMGLATLNVREIVGPPHHGGTMFRRSTYELVGGYREQFVVAQDLDLWLRLAERGRLLGLGQTLYQARANADSISSLRRDDQFSHAELAIACASARREGRDDGPLIERSRVIPQRRRQTTNRRRRSQFYCFLGGCLRDRNRVAARSYLVASLRENPLYLKAFALLASMHI